MSPIRLFLCGDVMTGRGIDQILPWPSDPRLHESFVTSAEGYVALAEKVHGPIARPVDFDYPWGQALQELANWSPDVRFINLETAITRSDHAWPGKAVHYRMHPGNVLCLSAAGIHGCALANNHVLDWGREGLRDTLATLAEAGIACAGAGSDAAVARAPALLAGSLRRGRVLVVSCGGVSSGIPPDWTAGAHQSGVYLLPELSAAAAEGIGAVIAEHKRPGDCAVVSIHWGGNWGYSVPGEQVAFAHRLIDNAGADVVHGHSSHHPRAIEVYRGKLVLYGCGDFINDYEGIQGYEAFRGDLSLMFLVDLDAANGRLRGLNLVVLQKRRFRLERPPEADVDWLARVLDREGRRFNTRVVRGVADSLVVEWDG